MRTSLSLLVGMALFAAPAIAAAQAAPPPAPAARPAGRLAWSPPADDGPQSGRGNGIRVARRIRGDRSCGSGRRKRSIPGTPPKAHYRDALARNGRSDTRGAMAEARAASSLARASMALVTPPVPHDVPAPPAPPAGGGMMGAADRPEGPPMDGDHGPMMDGRGGRGGMREHGDGIEDLGKLASLANTDEAKRFANDALGANMAAERAAFAGNREEAMRQRRLADALAGAVRALASLNMTPRQHPAPAAPAH